MGSDLVRKIKELLRRDGREWLLFLFCVALSAGIWVVHNLAYDYSADLNVPVLVKCNVEEHSAYADDICEVSARCRVGGYALITSRGRYKSRPIELQLDRSSVHYLKEDIFYTTSKDLQEHIHTVFGDVESVEHFYTDTLFFRLPVENSKKVPVVLHTEGVYFKPQYTFASAPVADPDSVYVYGDPESIESISEIESGFIKYYDLSSSKRGTVELIAPPDVRLSRETVGYSLPVVRYVSVNQNVKIQVRNVPSRRNLIVIPSEAEISLDCTFPLREDPFEDAVFYVDYKDYLSSHSGKCVLKADKLPQYVLSWRADPPVCECVEEERK